MHRLSFLLLAVPLLLSSCYRTEIEEAAPQLVVEGWIENGRAPVVQLTTTVPITTSKHSVDSLDRYVLKWARVTVSDGTKEVILTGVYNRRYTPPYLYTTGDMLGETGRTYTLKVDYAQFHAQAETAIPAAVGLSGIQARPLEDGSRRYTIKASVQDDPQRVLRRVQRQDVQRRQHDHDQQRTQQPPSPCPRHLFLGGRQGAGEVLSCRFNRLPVLEGL